MPFPLSVALYLLITVCLTHRLSENVETCETSLSFTFEPRHDKTNKMTVADLSLRWAHTQCVGFVMSWLIYRLSVLKLLINY